MKVLNYGSLNYDYVYEVDHINKPGETQSCQARNVFCGGKGLNQSVALARAGVLVYQGGLIGEDGQPFVLYDTWTEYLRYMLDESARLGKTCYVGEAGWMYQDATERQSYESALAVVESIASAAYSTRYPLILFWNYDPVTRQMEQDFVDRGSGVEYSWNENWDKGRAYLETIQKYNALFDRLIEEES